MILSGLTLAPAALAENLVVILHGWGSNANDVAGLVPALGLEHCHVGIPNGPMAHPYAGAGHMWYDLEAEQWPGLLESRELLQSYLKEQCQATGVPLERTILMGFSQGGAMSLEVGLGLPLLGLVVFSGYLHPHLAERPLRTTVPLLILHGEQDNVVPVQAAERTGDYLTQQGAQFDLHRLPSMGHEISPRALALAAQWLKRRIAQTSAPEKDC